MTTNEARLINLWLLVEKFRKLAEKKPLMFDNLFQQSIENYYVVWFEINQEKLERKRIEKWMENNIEDCDDEQEIINEEKRAIESLNSDRFQEYAYDTCISQLDLV